MGDTSLLEKIRKAPRVYIIGNGGSMANADHIANDLLSVGVKAFIINPSFFSATANDFGYEWSFARWLEIVGGVDDLVIALSGSGRSPNILKALRYAAANGMQTHLVTHHLKGRDMQESEEDQLVIGHEMMRALRES